MYRLIDQMMVFSCCFFILQNNPLSLHSLFYCLFSVIFICLYLYSSKGKFAMVLLFLYFTGILFLPSYYAMLPLLYYALFDVAESSLPALAQNIPPKRQDVSETSIQGLPLVITLISALSATWQIINTQPLKKVIICLILCALSLYLHHKTLKQQKNSQALISLRDYSQEQNILMVKKNRELASMQETQVHLATLKERNRIAREIHDNVGHMLTRSILQAAALDAINQNDTLSAPLHELQDTLNTAMTNIRTSVHDLHDDSVDLENVIRQSLTALTDFDLSFEYDMAPYVPRDIKYTLIAIVKEAASNIIKHSNGNHVQVLLREHPVFYQCSIRDNGRVDKIKNNQGIGLLNMKERIEGLKGTFFLSHENGFHILITIPKQQETQN